MSSRVSFPKLVGGLWVEQQAEVEYEVLVEGRWVAAHSNSCDNPLGELWTTIKGRETKVPPSGWRFKPKAEQGSLF